MEVKIPSAQGKGQKENNMNKSTTFTTVGMENQHNKAENKACFTSGLQSFVKSCREVTRKRYDAGDGFHVEIEVVDGTRWAWLCFGRYHISMFGWDVAKRDEIEFLETVYSSLDEEKEIYNEFIGKVDAEDDDAGLMFHVSDVTRNAIFNAYCLMKDYLYQGDVEDEECFCDMRYEVEKLKMLIPDCLFKEIDEFIDETLAPIVYDHDTVFADCMTDDIGYFDEDGSFHIHDEETMTKFAMNFHKVIYEIGQELDEFAMKTMRPYLV